VRRLIVTHGRRRDGAGDARDGADDARAVIVDIFAMLCASSRARSSSRMRARTPMERAIGGRGRPTAKARGAAASSSSSPHTRDARARG